MIPPLTAIIYTTHILTGRGYMQTLQPARAKAHRPYAPGMPLYNRKTVTVCGGKKGTGKQIARAYYTVDENNRLPSDNALTIRDGLQAVALKYGYTIVYYPKELRPQKERN